MNKYSPTSHEGVYAFYLDRITASRNYGLFSGDEILKVICRCAFNDSYLTETEFNSIIIQCEEMHKKLMEDNYNEQWK